MILNNKKRNCMSIKITTILVTSLMILTIFTSVVSSEGLLSSFVEKTKEKIQEKKEEIVTKVVNNIQEEVDNVKNKLSQDKESKSYNIKTLAKTSSSSSVFSLIKTFIGFHRMKTSSSSLLLHTSYNGNEIDTNLPINIPIKVDVDGDGNKDVKAVLYLLLGIERPLVLTFNFRLRIERLPDFPDVDESFEVYAQLVFPGIIDEANAGNIVRFGYVSDKYEEVPDNCVVTYKYYPYIFYKEKPKHIVKLNPGNIVEKDSLSVLFCRCKKNNTNIDVENIFKIKYEPAVVAETTFGIVNGTFDLDTSKRTTAVFSYKKIEQGVETANIGVIIYKLSSFSFHIKLTPLSAGGGEIEYIRQTDEQVDVLLFFEKESNVYVYADDIPQHVKLSWDPGINGVIELNTFDDRCSRIGIRDALIDEDVTANAYIDNLPNMVRVNWNWQLLSGWHVDLFCEQTGCSAHFETQNFMGQGAHIYAHATTKENIDMSFFWDMSEKCFGVDRTNNDLTLSAKIQGPAGGGLNFSGTIKNSISQPFKIIIGKLLDGESEIQFSGSSFELKNINADLQLPGIGKFILKINRFKFSKQDSGVRFALSVTENNEITTLRCELEVFEGIELIGLVIGYNDFLYPVGDIVDNSHQIHVIEASIENIDNIDFWFSTDFSQGYIEIRPGSSLTVAFNSIFEKPVGNLVGTIEGAITFKSKNDKFNISWLPVGGKTQLNVDGTGVLSLTGFHLWVKNKLDITIGAIIGEFNINTFDDEPDEIIFKLDKASIALSTDFSIDIEGSENIIFKADINLDCDLVLDGYLKILLYDNGPKIETSNIGVGYSGLLMITDLYVKYQNIEGSADQIYLIGDMRLYFNLDFTHIIFSSSGGISFNVEGFSFDYGATSISWTQFYAAAKGSLKIFLDMDEIYIDIDGALKLVNADISALGIPGLSSLSISATASVKGLYLKGLLKGQPPIEIRKTGTDVLKIDSFYVLLNGNQAYIEWDKLHIGGAGSLKVDESIVFDATLSYILFENFYANLNAKNMFINGEATLTYGGKLTIEADLGAFPKIEVDLSSGNIDLKNFHIGVDNKAGTQIDASWYKLHIEGSFNIELLVNPISRESKIIANGNGIVTLEDALIFDSGKKVDVDIGYFKVDLSDVSATVKYIANEKGIMVQTFQSASGSGKINELTIKDTIITLDVDLYLGEDLGNLKLIVDEAEIDFSGDGSFNFDIYESSPPKVTFQLSVNDQDAFICVVKFYIEIENFLLVDIDDLSLQSSTTILLEIVAEWIGENLPKFKFNAGINSDDWSIGKLSLSADIGDFMNIFVLEGFTGKGQITLGVRDVVELNTNKFPKDIVIELNGNWNWNKLSLFVGEDFGPIKLQGGSFDGHANIYFDFLMLYYGMFNLAELGGEIFDHTTLSIQKLEGWDGYFALGSLDLNPGTIDFSMELDFLDPFDNPPDGIGYILLESSGTVNPKINMLRLVKYSYNIDIALASVTGLCPYFEISWEDIEFSAESLPIAGKLKIDTNNQYCTFSLNIINFINLLDVSFKADDLIISWDLNGDGIGFVEITNNDVELQGSIGILNMFTITGTLAHRIRLDWDINFDGSGYLKLDTDHEWSGITIEIFKLIKLNGGFWAEDKEISWTFQEGKLFPDLDIGGEWSFDLLLFGIAIFVASAGAWFALLGDTPAEGLSGTFIDHTGSMDHQNPDDTFKVAAFDGNSGSAVSGATAKYYWADGTFQGQQLTTGSDGKTNGEFICHIKPGETESDCYIKIIHPDYTNDKILNFHVEPDTAIFHCDAGGPYESEEEIEVQFSGNAFFGITPYIWNWNFGDGHTGTGQTPVHIYNSQGTYTITLTVTDSQGNTVSDTTTANIIEVDHPPYFTNPDITGPDVGEYDHSVGPFVAHVNDDDGDALEYQWQWETFSGVPMTSGWFKNDNDYSVLWSVGTPPFTRWVRVQARQQNDNSKSTGWSGQCVVWITKRPNADAGGPYSGSVGEPIEFDGSGSIDYDGYITSWDWDFDNDGQFDDASGEIVQWTWNSPVNNYPIKLRVTDDKGLTDTDSKTIIVTESGTWIRPTGFNDPDNFWNDETKAYDGSTSTKAESNKYKGITYQYCSPIELTFSEIDCTKVKFYAWHDPTYCPQIKIEYYSSYSNSWPDIYSGEYDDKTWETISLGTKRTFSKIRVSFMMKGYPIFGTSAELFEIQLYDTS